jgi:hypothetical protein
VNCQECQAKSITFLCGKCITDLTDRLTDLPWWIARLEEQQVGHVRMGDSGGRPSARREPFQGEDEVPRHDPALLRRFLAAGGVNARASELAHNIHNSLGTWIKHLCEQRGLVTPTLVRSGQRARWLMANVNAIAADEAAGECLADVTRHKAAIENVINRPPTPRFVGPCTHYVEHERHCGKLLFAKRDAIEVMCPVCRTTHNVERITQNLIVRIDVLRFTSQEILMIMDAIGTPIPERTWRRWRLGDKQKDKKPLVKIRGYKRPDNDDGTRGSIGLTRHNVDDEPAYRLQEVRKVYAEAIRHTDALCVSS